MLALATWRMETAASCTRKPQRVGDAALDGFLGERAVEGDGAAREPGRRSGRGRCWRRSWWAPHRPCRSRPAPAQSLPTAARCGANSPRRSRRASRRGADGQHLDAGEADRIAVLHVPVGGHAQIAPVAERDIGAGAAHVEADGVLVARELGDEAARDGPRRDARGGEPGRELGRRLLGHHAAAGVQQQDVLVVAAFAGGGWRDASRSRRRPGRAPHWPPSSRSVRARRSRA